MMFSIIVPIYKAEKTIDRLIKSVLNQSIVDWELLLIDDGSPDKSGEICDSYALKDSRILCVHQENAGVSSARNKGLNLAKGDWITFIDADDYIEPTHLSVFKKQIDDKSELCINSFYIDLKYQRKIFAYPSIKVQDRMDILYLFFHELRQHSQFLWNKAFKRCLIETYHLRFNTEVSLGEDNIFILRYLPLITKISSCSESTYNYNCVHENNESLGTKYRKPSEMLFQINSNTNALYRIYIDSSCEYILNIVSDYYFTRIFDRILLLNTRKYKKVFVKPIHDPVCFLAARKELDFTLIANKWIRLYWKLLAHKNLQKSLFVFNLYKMLKCLKYMIRKVVVDVKHTCKFV